MKIKLYTRPQCQPCKATKKTLDRLGLEYSEETIDDSNREYLVGLNAMMAPVVVVDHGEGNSETWSGFRPDSLKALVTT